MAAMPAAEVAHLPACDAAHLSLHLDVPSRSGALLVLRNEGAAACALSGRPGLRFEDENRHPLPIAFCPPPGMHPGPAVPAVGIAPGAEITAKLG